jgi:hypothetical protein
MENAPDAVSARKKLLRRVHQLIMLVHPGCAKITIDSTITEITSRAIR